MLKTAALVILILGDLNFTGLGFMMELEKNNYNVEFPFQKTAARIEEADIAVANLEGPLTFAEWADEAKLKKWKFRQLPAFAQSVANSGIDIVLLANNHIADAGEQGIIDTMKYLSEAGITWVPPPREGPLKLNRNNMMIEMWNADFLSPAGSHPWAITIDDLVAAIKKVGTPKQDGTMSIAFIHYHDSGSDTTRKKKLFARKIMEAGIEWVIFGGDHYPPDNPFIAESGIHMGLGDFIFGCECSGSDYGKALLLTVSSSGTLATEVPLTPGYQGNGFVPRFNSLNR